MHRRPNATVFESQHLASRFEAKQREEVSDFFDDGVCADQFGHSRISSPYRLHARRSRTGDVDLGMVAYEDRRRWIGLEALQRTTEDLRIWLADALGGRNQDGIERR